jgi:hypothetical protein
LQLLGIAGAGHSYDEVAVDGYRVCGEDLADDWEQSDARGYEPIDHHVDSFADDNSNVV